MKNTLQHGLIILGVLAIILWQTGCNPFAGDGEIGEITSFENYKKYLKNKEQDGKRIALVGYLSVSSAVHQDVLGDKLNSVNLISELENAKHSIVLKLPLSNDKEGKNVFYVPTQFEAKDALFFDNAGKSHPYNEKLKVSFTLKRNTAAEPEKNEATGEYSWDFEQVRIDPAN